MDDHTRLNRVHSTIAWGAIFTWWGTAEILNLPNGMDALGIGLVLFGLIFWRRWHGLSSNGFTVTFAILALAWGALDLSRSVLQMPLTHGAEFAVLLIVFGATLLVLGFGANSATRWARG